MKSDAITIESGPSGAIEAWLDLPTGGRPLAYAVLAHCSRCLGDDQAASRVATALADHGIATLRVDLGPSSSDAGAKARGPLGDGPAIVTVAASWLATEHDAPRILIGHSQGGAAVLQAAAQVPSARAVATIGAPFAPPDVPDPGAAIKGLRKALLVLHSPVDDVVPVDEARAIYVAAMHPKSFLSLDGADHRLSRLNDAVFAASMIAAWARRYTGVHAPVDAYPDPGDMPVVVRTPAQGFRTDVLAAGHRLVADEPVEFGGTDEGPGPYDLLMSSLGACTSMTLQMYARRKKWPLESATVRLRHKKIHAKDCDDCETDTGRIDVLERELILEGDLDAEQRTRLTEIADRCPVHRTLHGQIKVRTTLLD